MKNLHDVKKMGIEGLMSLVKRVAALLTEPNLVNPVITKSSVLGLFIRRTSVIFEQLSCSGVVAVSKVFKRYCESCSAALQDTIDENATDAEQKTSVINQDFQVR